ncbi:thioesterase family protein [Sulfurivirga sp.]|uniref:acyl-CoA thioesterase n=1 Tax=Sulfurivirga sp. TaxID=2614236 RepID=UPI0025F6D117|nr:acyl-CoA thioesterase [Sulfurivirga sp.]
MFTIELKVRDYECDLQGVVNNARYLHYMEHARHEFLQARGIDFAALAAEGVDLMLTRVEVDYRRPLRPGDVFTVSVQVEQVSRLKFCFVQEIRRADGELMASGRNYGVAVRDGRPLRYGPLLALADA